MIFYLCKQVSTLERIFHLTKKKLQNGRCEIGYKFSLTKTVARQTCHKIRCPKTVHQLSFHNEVFTCNDELSHLTLFVHVSLR